MTDPTDPTEVARAFGASDAKLLGSGTYGDTYLIHGIPEMSGPSAVKLLKPASYDKRRAEREMSGMRRFDGPGVARLLDVRTLDVDGSERVALVCEYVEGGNVQARLDVKDLPSHRHLRKFAAGLLATVVQLHATETCHRDIKPLNILLRDGKWAQPVLIDFGMSRMISDATITEFGAFIGSWGFMPPEHLSGEPARKSADLWACGVTLHLLTTGEHPFVPDGTGPMSVEDLLALVSGAARPLPPDLPDDLRSVIQRLLSEVPHQRGTARRALKDLDESER